MVHVNTAVIYYQTIDTIQLYLVVVVVNQLFLADAMNCRNFGTVFFSSSDLVAMQMGKFPADYGYTAADAGTHVFSVSLMTPPSQTITVTDTANSSLSATSPPIAVGAM